MTRHPSRPIAIGIAALLVAACTGSSGPSFTFASAPPPAASASAPAASPAASASAPAASVMPPMADMVSPDTSSARLSSTAAVTIVKPTTGETVTGTILHVVTAVTGATIVDAATTTVTPDHGHVHLYVDNVLVSMGFGLELDVSVHPGTYVLKAEFVAADHAPFNPRVWSPEVFITVQ